MPLPPQRNQGAALVTGASSGIGEQFARQLGERGYNLILVARRHDRLSKLAEDLASKTARAEVLQCDLATQAGWESLPGRVSELGLEVDLLVNSAGFGSIKRFTRSTLESQVDQIRVNCEAVVALTHLFAPAMVNRGFGAIVNVASVAGFQPLPYEAVYSASKAFAGTFGDALHVELRGTGVNVLSVNPGPVPTEWQQIAGIEHVQKLPPPVSAAQVAREAIEAVDKDKRSIVPGLATRLSMLAATPAPRSLKLRVMELANRGRANG